MFFHLPVESLLAYNHVDFLELWYLGWMAVLHTVLTLVTPAHGNITNFTGSGTNTGVLQMQVKEHT